MLFSDVNLNAQGTTKIGLIGDNGSGKSSLLKILAGLDSASDGKVYWNKESRVGYLEQEITTDTFEVSGGEKKILKLTELFYGDYNVLLLDEPDNHLDLDHKDWFENLVKEYEGIVIVISHDRRFLENSVDKIWYLDEGKIKEYPFNYSKFKDVYERDMKSRSHLWETQEKERLRLKAIIAAMRIKANSNDKFAGRYHSAEKKYIKFVSEMVEKPPVEKKVHMSVTLEKQHKTKTALYLKNIFKSYGDLNILNDLSLHLSCGQKIAITAPNGSGKSTLLNIIVGISKADSGEVYIGPGLKIGYYAQEHLEALDPNATMIEEIQKTVPIHHYDAIAYLKKFLFTPNQIKLEVRFLSGGQKSRLQLAKFLATNPDILVLDEPTNHLDLKTVLALENFLINYEGTLILVSHDQELVENVTDTILNLKSGKLGS